MPLNFTLYYERRVAEAAQAFSSGQFPSIAAAARKFGVERKTVSTRLHGVPPRTAKTPNNKGLNSVQEDALLYWIKFLDNSGFPPTKSMVVSYANQIRRRDQSGAPHLSVKWGARWLKAQRANGLFVKKIKSIEAKRQAAFDRPSIAKWFEKLHKAIVENGLQSDDILNFDETGYRIGVAGDQDIVTFHPDRRNPLPNDTNHEHVTLTETISAGGWVIPPVIIIQGSVHLERYFQDLPAGYLLAVSDSGYTNDEISYETIKHIDRFTKPRMKGKYRLLLLDNHECHLSLDFLEYCEDANIIPFGLPPHTTHFLQPLDVGCFQPNKHYHRQAVNQATRMGNRDYSRVDFFADIEGIRNQTFKELTIKSAFKKTGIWPFNPEIVLQKLKEFEPPQRTPTPETPLSPGFLSCFPKHLHPPPRRDPIEDFEATAIYRGTVRSPENAREFMALGQSVVSEILRSSPEIPAVELALSVRRLSEAAAKRVARGQIAIDDLQRTTAYQAAKESRKRAGRKRLQTGGVLYAEEARLEIEHRERLEEMAAAEQQQKAYERQKKKGNERKIKQKDLLIFRPEKLQMQLGEL
jgi:DDE superfamily endonuclease/Tc5 transposase DNA-binding domain